MRGKGSEVRENFDGRVEARQGRNSHEFRYGGPGAEGSEVRENFGERAEARQGRNSHEFRYGSDLRKFAGIRGHLRPKETKNADDLG